MTPTVSRVGRRARRPAPRRSSPSSTATSSARATPSARWPSRCATAGAGSSSSPTLREEIAAQEHHHDRPDRASARPRSPAAWPGWREAPFLKVEASQVHRGRLRRPRRRVDGPRPGRDRGRHGARGASAGEVQRDAPTQRAEERLLDAPACPARDRRRGTGAEADRVDRDGRARSCASKLRAGGARRPRGRDRGRPTPRSRASRSSRRRASRRWASTSRTCSPGMLQPHAARQQDDGRRGARGPRAARRPSKLVDREQVQPRGASSGSSRRGIVFLDEIDKIAGPRGAASGPDVSREGVQRDLLPIVEGSTVATKYGPVAPTTSCSSPPAPSTSASPRT